MQTGVQRPAVWRGQYSPQRDGFWSRVTAEDVREKFTRNNNNNNKTQVKIAIREARDGQDYQ